MIKVILLLLLSQSLFLISNSLQCLDENKRPVDWFIVYKFPEIEHHTKLLKAGLAYSYLTSNYYSAWKLSNYSINDTNSIIANTIYNLYSKDKKEDLLYVLYNDQPPNSKSKANKGHNKGVIMANDTNGFWLVHSVPHFPVLENSYIFPRSGSVFGQSFLCISMDLQNLNKVGLQLQYNQPEIYGVKISFNQTSVPDLIKAANNFTVRDAPWYHVQNINSNNGSKFISFAKSKEFDKELYEDLVAPMLESDLYVETWPNSPGRLKSDCTKKFKVNNIQSIFFKMLNVSFTTTHDHSKWAVSSISDNKNWLCIGDINRAEHQKVRGGGTVCLLNKKIAIDFQKCIDSIEQCQKE